jgi:broad-specificity NMP kinase
MKQLIIINGAMGVGKSYACKVLNKRLMNSVWLDGDWCMMMNPLNFTPENTKMFLDNCIYLLKNFLSNPTINYIFFSWVFPREDILNYIIKQVYDTRFEVIKISLICSDDQLITRMRTAGRDEITIEKSIVYQEVIRLMDTVKVDTTELEEAETIEEVLKIIK